MNLVRVKSLLGAAILAVTPLVFAPLAVAQAAQDQPTEPISKPSPDDASAQADALVQQARILENQGKYQEADEIYAQVYLLRNEALGELHPDTIIALGDYAYTRQVLGDLASAAELFGNLAIMSGAVFGESDVNTITYMSNQGRSLMMLGQLDEAEPVITESLRLFRETLGESSPQTLGALNNYASLLDAQNRRDAALPIYERVLTVRRETLGPQHQDTIESLSNYGLALFNQGRFEEAGPVLEEALETGRTVLGTNNFYTLTALMNYGATLEVLGQLPEAEAINREARAMQLAMLGETHPWSLLGLNNLANTLKNQARYEEAEPLLDESVGLHRSLLGERHPTTLSVMLNHAKVLVAKRSYDRALERTAALASVMRGRAFDLATQGLRGSAQRDRELENRHTFEKFFALVLWGSRGRAQTPEEALVNEALQTLQLASADSTTSAVREAAAARYASEAGQQTLIDERRGQIRDWAALEEALVASETSGQANAQSRAAARTRLAQIETRITQIDTRLATEAPQYFAILRNEAIDNEALADVLDPDEAVLLLVPTDYRTHAMVVTREGIAWHFSDMDTQAVADMSARLREGLEIDAGSPFLPVFDMDLAYKAYTDLIAPLEDELAGASRVYVVADGPLSRVPLGTLITSAPPEGADGDDPEVLRSLDWLADKFALVQLPSLQSLVYIRAFERSESGPSQVDFAGFGAPVLDGEGATRGARSATLAPVDAASLRSELRGQSGAYLMEPKALKKLAALPGTRAELEQVRAALGASDETLFLAERMTESSIKTSDLSTTSILHFATHGFTSEESGLAAEPGLVFTPPDQATQQDDGYLAASEVVGLDLGSARWVIMSACNTASPSGKPGESGLSGLAQAFFYAGAQSLLVSHWPVFDDVAPVLTVRALTLSQAGMPRAEALQKAMQEVRNDPELDAAHPAVWAPFALVGEGR